MKRLIVLIAALALLSSLALGASTLTSLERNTPSNSMQVLQVDLESNSTGYLSYTTNNLTGQLYAIEWVNTSTTALGGDNTLWINATFPYTYTVSSYNMSNVSPSSGYREYPRDTNSTTLHMIPIRSALNFFKLNDTSEMTATILLYLER